MNFTRRHALMGLACAFGAGGAYALTPRNHVRLLGDDKLENIVPKQFGSWSDKPTNAIVTADDDDLASRLYSQILTRMYVNEDSGNSVMMLIAYGDTQNDMLQLHRPEVCYPAFGFVVEESRRHDLDVGGAVVPSRVLTASASGRVEHILYWTRIGEHLPTDGREQRVAKLQDQFAGIIPDGVLVRISLVGPDKEEAFAAVSTFARDMVHAIKPTRLPALIGTQAASGVRSA